MNPATRELGCEVGQILSEVHRQGVLEGSAVAIVVCLAICFVSGLQVVLDYRERKNRAADFAKAKAMIAEFDAIVKSCKPRQPEVK